MPESTSGDDRVRSAVRVRRSTLQEQVRHAIEDLIVVGELAPGERLPEVGLAERLGVSRQPVREALHTLVGSGFVDILPGRGASVHAPTVREIREVFHVRSLLESDLADLAARTIDDAGVARLRAVCDEYDRQADRVELLRLNRRFHDTIADIAGNDVSATLLGQLQRRVSWYQERVVTDRAHDSWAEHRQIVDALADHDGDAARTLMLRHIHETLDRIDATQR